MTLTMEEIEELPVGRSVTLNDPNSGAAVWTRAEGGLAQGNTTIALRHFAAAINEGLFSVSPPMRTGYWTRGNMIYYVVDRFGDEWFVMEMNQQWQYAGWRWATNLEGAEYPTMFAPALEHVQAARWLRYTGAALYSMEVTRKRQEAEHVDQLTRIGQAFVSFADTYLDDNREQLFGVLSSHNIPFERPSRDVDVRLTVTGTSSTSRPDYEDLDLPEQFHEDDRDGVIRVYWTYDINTNVPYTGFESDACEDRDVFDNEWAQNWLADNVSGDWDADSVEIDSRGCSDC